MTWLQGAAAPALSLTPVSRLAAILRHLCTPFVLCKNPAVLLSLERSSVPRTLSSHRSLFPLFPITPHTHQQPWVSDQHQRHRVARPRKCRPIKAYFPDLVLTHLSADILRGRFDHILNNVLHPLVKMNSTYSTLNNAKKDIIEHLDALRLSHRSSFGWPGIHKMAQNRAKSKLAWALAVKLWDNNNGVVVQQPPHVPGQTGNGTALSLDASSASSASGNISALCAFRDISAESASGDISAWSAFGGSSDTPNHSSRRSYKIRCSIHLRDTEFYC